MSVASGRTRTAPHPNTSVKPVLQRVPFPAFRLPSNVPLPAAFGTPSHVMTASLDEAGIRSIVEQRHIELTQPRHVGDGSAKRADDRARFTTACVPSTYFRASRAGVGTKLDS